MKISGLQGLKRTLNDLGHETGPKAAIAATRAATRAVLKGIKSEVPVKLRQAFGSKVKKFRSGFVTAKAGAGVGKRKAAKSRNGKSGVGISKNNIHWWVLGTGVRKNKKGNNRGRMPAHPVVKRGASKSESQAIQLAALEAWKTIRKDAEKLRRKNKG